MKLNKSKTYLTYYFSKYIPIKFHKQLLNTYIAFNQEYYIWGMLYKFSGKKEFTDFEQKLLDNPYFKKSIDVSKETVLYLFNIPEELDDIIHLFISGKYSKLPNIDSLIIYLNKHFYLPLDHDIIKILKKDKEYKNKLEEELDIIIPDGLDLTDVPDLDSENFNYNNGKT